MVFADEAAVAQQLRGGVRYPETIRTHLENALTQPGRPLGYGGREAFSATALGHARGPLGWCRGRRRSALRRRLRRRPPTRTGGEDDRNAQEQRDELSHADHANEGMSVVGIPKCGLYSQNRRRISSEIS